MSTILRSVAYGELKQQRQASLKEVNFSAESNQVIKAKNLRDSFSINFATIAENVVEVGGTITVSF